MVEHTLFRDMEATKIPATYRQRRKGLRDMDTRAVIVGERADKGGKWQWKSTIKRNKKEKVL